MKIIKGQTLNESVIGGYTLVESADKYPFDLKKATHILEAKPAAPEGNAILCTVVYPICNIGKPNANRRIYGRDVWEKVFHNPDVIDQIRNRKSFGHSEHPEGTQSKTPQISHFITKMWMDENRVYQEFSILNTPEGRIIETLLLAKCDIGVSTRAEGDLREEKDKDGNVFYHVISEAYKYKVTDFTADPSTFGTVPMDVKRNIIAAVKKEVESKTIQKEEREFATTILESITCKDKSKCQKCGNCQIKEEQISIVAAPTDGSVMLQGDVNKVTIDKSMIPPGSAAAQAAVTVTVNTVNQNTQVPEVAANVSPAEPPVEAEEVNEPEPEMEDEDFEKDIDLDVEESKQTNETKEVKALYNKAGLKPPKGKGVHTKAFHKCAVGYAKKVKSGKLSMKDAYKRCMGALGKKKAVKKAHQRNESAADIITYIITYIINENIGVWGEKVNQALYQEGYNVKEDEVVRVVDEITKDSAKLDQFLDLLSGTDTKALLEFLKANGLKLNKVEEVKSKTPAKEIVKEMNDLKVKAAIAEAEKQTAMEMVNELKDKELQSKIAVNKVNEIRKTTKVNEITIEALRNKLEEKAKQLSEKVNKLNEASARQLKEYSVIEHELTAAKEEITKLKKEIADLKTKLAETEKKNETKLTEAVATAKKDERTAVIKEVIKEYVTKQLTGKQVHDNLRALLENCQTLAEVDKVLDESTEVARRRALHTGPIKGVIVEKHVTPPNPKDVQDSNIISTILKL